MCHVTALYERPTSRIITAAPQNLISSMCVWSRTHAVAAHICAHCIPCGSIIIVIIDIIIIMLTIITGLHRSSHAPGRLPIGQGGIEALAADGWEAKTPLDRQSATCNWQSSMPLTNHAQPNNNNEKLERISQGQRPALAHRRPHHCVCMSCGVVAGTTEEHIIDMKSIVTIHGFGGARTAKNNGWSRTLAVPKCAIFIMASRR